MDCPTCGTPNEPGRKFCGECGTALLQACPNCGAQNAPGTKFCGECGTSLRSEAPPAGAERRPQPTAERRIVSVLFADLVGFTPWAQRTHPARVVAVLDGLFSRLDALATECGVEKIKTIGDSYMAVAGAPQPRPDHAFAALTLAQRMLSAQAEICEPLKLPLQMRVGLASGSVVAGVIGQQRILFDLWGDTVNIASRMESAGVPGGIQVSASTRALLGNDYSFEEREAIEVKGLGLMTTYLVTS